MEQFVQDIAVISSNGLPWVELQLDALTPADLRR